ncbi:Eukaryotic protein implicated in cell cycle regulation [Schizosaccharomyces pombe]
MAATTASCISFSQFQRLKKLIDSPASKHKPMEFKGTSKDDLEDDLNSFFDCEEELFLSANKIFYSKLRVYQTVRHWSLKQNWSSMSLDQKRNFILHCHHELSSGELLRNSALYSILYIAAGAYDSVGSFEEHVHSISENVYLLREFDIPKTVYSLFIEWNRTRKHSFLDNSRDEGFLNLLLSLMFFFLTLNNTDKTWIHSIRSLNPPVLPTLVKLFIDITSDYQLNLDKVIHSSLKKLSFLIFKVCIRLWGSQSYLQEKKAGLAEVLNISTSQQKPKTTALDYEVFRHEMATKFSSFADSYYPVPLDREQAHILPTLNTDSFHKSSFISSTRLCSPENPSLLVNTAKTSKMSARREQFQTNQNLPFCFTPNLEKLTIPYSVTEAANVFQNKTKRTLAVEQLLSERELLRRFTLQQRLGADLHEFYNSVKGPAHSFETEDPVLKFVSQSYDDLFPYMDNFIQLAVQLFYHISKKVNCLYVEAFSSSDAVLQRIQDNAVVDSPTEELSEQAARNRKSNVKIEYTEDFATGFAISGEISHSINNLEFVLYSLSSLFLMMLKWFRLSHVLRFERLAFLLYENHFLEIFNRHLTEGDCNRNTEKDVKCVRGGFFSYSSKMYKYDRVSIPVITRASSSRNLLITMNCLRVLEKVCKYSNIRKEIIARSNLHENLKKLLAIPHDKLRLYALKVLKLSVPFLGLKWKQANMSIITQIYLNCSLDLRDSWMFHENGSDTYRSAQLQETFLAILIRFYHIRLYGKKCKSLYQFCILEEMRLKKSIEELAASNMMEYIPESLWSYSFECSDTGFFENEFAAMHINDIA